MKVVIDFCGYRIPDDKFGVKEFSIYYVNKDNKIVRKIFNIVKAPCEWHSLKPETKKEYKKLYEKYGINYKTGFCNYNISICVLCKYLKHMKTIYVKNDTQKDLLEKYILRSKKLNIICMDAIGFNGAEEMTTKCRSHELPDKNNCVNDNALAMVDWLLKNKNSIDNDEGKENSKDLNEQTEVAQEVPMEVDKTVDLM